MKLEDLVPYVALVGVIVTFAFASDIWQQVQITLHALKVLPEC